MATNNRTIDRSVNAANQRREGLNYARTHLSHLPEVVYLRLGRTFGWHRPDQAVWINQGEGRDEAVSWWCWWTFWAALPLAAYGTLVLHRRRVNLWPFAATLITTVAVTAAFYGIPRFRLPLEVSIVVLVGVAIDAVIRHLCKEEEADPRDDDSADSPTLDLRERETVTD
jgi:hypothetical protein